MRKDYVKKKNLIKNEKRYRLSNKSRRSRSRIGKHVTASRGRSLFLTLLLIVLASFFCGIAFFAYYYKHHSMASLTVPSYFSKMKTWLAERHNASNSKQEKKHEKAKRLASDKNQHEQAIHFEFYQALPSMQVPVPNVIANNDIQSTINRATVERVKNSAPSQMHDTTPANPKLINVEELERDLAKQFQQNYIIQLGVFRSLDAAKRYQKFLAGSGFSAKVNKISLVDKTLFRVEQGPFLNKAQVKIAQLRLQQKGLKTFILTK